MTEAAARAQSQDVEADVSPEDVLRADLYDFLAALLARPPSRALIDQAAALRGEGGDLGAAVDALARVARATTEHAAKSEFDALFIGVVRGELLPYASYYLTGFLNEKPLAKLRADMARFGMERAGNVHEPEDNIASLCEMMAGLIRGRFGPPASLAAQRDFFATHLGPWARHFFTDLEGAQASVLYAPVGAIGKQFMDIEREAFRMERGS
ncbi:TorD/DmsD family molecular chaperone [Rubrimonas cliftonensis]|uniref:Chaperone TorD involved in molybdoenzyme TorA maturation n=1 Tax=Rubrimonas cliftonensis TaxID=89524 RepID=A0A1H4D2D3_9RHOB|nr:molecular chaperone TorD family protein [Rubrimonas cliftonensis]SEA66864.1 chaperone TorD involved in molybdoenzyme TorA maturation [Rubrimonas cliftonensis]